MTVTNTFRTGGRSRPRGAACARLLWAAAAALFIALWAAPASAQQAAAEALFNQGRALMQERNYAEACEKFAASHELDPSVGALLNLGDCREKNGQTATAWATYREAVSLSRRTGDRRRERFAQSRAAALEGKLSYLVIEVSDEARVPGLTLTRSGEPVLEAVWDQRVPTDPGSYVIRAEAPGYRPAEVEAEVGEGGGEARVTIPELEKAAAGEVTGPSAADAPVRAAGDGEVGVSASGGSEGGMPTGRKIAIGVGAAGVVALAAGAVFGLNASSKWDKAKSHCVDGDFSNCDDQGVQLSKDATVQANLSTVSLSVGVLAAAGAAVLWFTSAPDDTGAERSARFTPLLTPDTVGASLLLHF
ncbi:tetratricopeptide repeat protein [Haliangium ochraceum]|uniref:Tetratricopeptide TPR_2 repeat protein n=1 Tax=Haliangium ochraceum (strain DSM 14365 / JCM 11303 / SMP-2) TaxID=502025 RepID=D0LYD8_HALO1|nr:tetratricopeptide repeat protein [Haliangium ochraceum]ACY16288.1 Tetratricopeptide TPR_2 repeat protein [Haliangium ochraceum DSM 14365]